MLAIYGAAGYTGRLVAARAREQGHDVVLAGRSRERLTAVAVEGEGAEATNGASTHGSVEVRVAGVDDPLALAAALRGCDAVVNCAGPFTRLGEPVVRAAIAAGCHYVDTTAEQLYIKRIFDTCAADAQAAGVTVVPAAGYDIVPGDLLSHETGARVEPLERLTLAYDIRDFGMTRGSMHSVLEMYTGGEVAYRDGDWVAASGPTRRDPVRFPDDAEHAATVRWPAGEIVTVPRHLRVGAVDVVMRSGALVPRPVAPIAPTLAPIMTAVMKTPLRPLLGRLIDRLPAGPQEDKRRRARFAFVADAHGADGRRARGILRGHDVYATTAVIAVEAAARLAAGGVQAGVLAPAQAFDPVGFLDALAPAGVSWEVSEKSS